MKRMMKNCKIHYDDDEMILTTHFSHHTAYSQHTQHDTNTHTHIIPGETIISFTPHSG